MKTALRLLLSSIALATVYVRPALAEDAPMTSELVPAYVKIADALAADDLAAAKTAASALSDHAAMVGQKQIAEQASAVSDAAAISAARERFKALSISIEPLAVGLDGYRVMTCAMAKGEWVQASGDVKNPYLGKAMLSCGEPKRAEAEPHDNHNHVTSAAHGCGDATTDEGHGEHGCG